MPHLVLLGDSIFDNAQYTCGGTTIRFTLTTASTPPTEHQTTLVALNWVPGSSLPMVHNPNGESPQLVLASTFPVTEPTSHVEITVAVGTTIADRPPPSGGTVARSGLR